MYLTLCLFLLLSPFYVGLRHQRLKLNQFEIQSNEISYGTVSAGMAAEYLLSLYLAGVNRLLSREPAGAIDYRNIQHVFQYVFENVPYYGVVYPTETYYYYSFDLPGKAIGGNFRFLDAAGGGLHIGYFDRDDPHSETFHKVLGAADGVGIRMLTPALVLISYGGKSALFRTSSVAAQAPRQTKLLPVEEWVTQAHDESGLRWHLLFNTETSTFYYILNEDVAAPENFNAIKENNRFLIGERSSYIVYSDDEFPRKILVGVSRENIYWNNYFDGPFDQVPPRLPLQEKIHKAYPYTRYAGGIDQHGNFISKAFSGSRVAISPYFDYPSVSDLLSYLKRCEKHPERSPFWSCLTYEWKKDFHKTLEAKRYPTHIIPYSQGWPANHLGSASLNWPKRHLRKDSLGWPKNHAPESSAGDSADAHIAENTAVRGEEQVHRVYTSQAWPANHHGTHSESWPADHTREQSSTWPENHAGRASSAQAQ